MMLSRFGIVSIDLSIWCLMLMLLCVEYMVSSLLLVYVVLCVLLMLMIGCGFVEILLVR